MEAKELHVGNYLLYNGKPYRVIQVNGVIGDSWMLENGEENAGEPIPLTKDIFENNGFKVTQFYNEEDIDDYKSVYIHDKDGETLNVTYWNYSHKISILDTNTMTMVHIIIDFVHELQNALNMAKVDKEIVL